MVMDWTTDPEAPLSLSALLLLLALRSARHEAEWILNIRPDSVLDTAQRTRTFCWDVCSDAHCLCYNFPVDPHPSPGELWCVIQGQVDGNVYLYDCAGTMIQSTSPLGEEVKTTNTWETQRETLRDIGDFLKGQLPDIIPEKHAPRDPLTLQGRMTCQCEEDGHISGSWQFGFKGEMCLCFDSENGHWTMDHSGGRWIKEKWEKDRAVTDFFKKVSMETVGPGFRSLWCTGRKC